MIGKSNVVKVYDGDLIGWTYGTLIEKHIRFESLERWTIETLDGTNLVRWVKEHYSDFAKDGCGYVLKEGYITEAKVNFYKWNKEEYYETYDCPEYYRRLYESNREKTYSFKWDGKEFWELINEIDEREGALFYTKELIFQ
jgi:hypothetical protein